MNIEKYVAVAGLPGIHILLSSRSNGLLIEDTNEGRTRFVSIRQNAVTPLSSIGMYVDTDEGQDTIPLGDVFQKMLDAYEQTPPVNPASASNTDLRNYFTAVVPNHDAYRVHISDIKKCIKWFNYMREKGLFEHVEESPAEESPAAPITETDTPTTEA